MIKTFLSKFLKQPPLPRDGRYRLGWLSTWNAKCGIAEYSKFLVDEFDPQRFDLTILASKNDALLSPDDDRVARCWTDRNGSARVLLDTLKRERFDALVIQFNFGFLTLQDLAAVILCCRSVGTKILVVFHSTADADIGGQIVSLSQITAALGQADGILVHSTDDIARLRGFGLSGNLSQFPHGYLCTPPCEQAAARAELGLPEDGLVIGSYGFLLPHKGTEQLIEAAALLRQANQPAKLLLVNALYPIPQSRKLLESCQALAGDLGIAEDVIFENDFLPNDASLRKLAACNLIVYAYQGTKESSSAAVRMGIAARRPVLCSPLSIFSDVSEVVRFLPGTRPEDIRDGVLAFLADESDRRQLSDRQDQWLETHAWSRVAGLLQTMLVD